MASIERAGESTRINAIVFPIYRCRCYEWRYVIGCLQIETSLEWQDLYFKTKVNKWQALNRRASESQRVRESVRNMN